MGVGYGLGTGWGVGHGLELGWGAAQMVNYRRNGRWAPSPPTANAILDNLGQTPSQLQSLAHTPSRPQSIAHIPSWHGLARAEDPGPWQGSRTQVLGKGCPPVWQGLAKAEDLGPRQGLARVGKSWLGCQGLACVKGPSTQVRDK